MTTRAWNFENLEEYMSYKRCYCPVNLSKDERKEWERETEIRYFKETDPAYTAKRIMRLCKKLLKGLEHREIVASELGNNNDVPQFMLVGLYNLLADTREVIQDSLSIMEEKK
jgi:hypothetical protein